MFPPSFVVEIPCKIEPLLGIFLKELSVCHNQDCFKYCQEVSLFGIIFPFSSTFDTRYISGFFEDLWDKEG